ncbi:hypothetical protein SAMN06265365_10993 [Tistlia consotensis]|uniref:NACHT domain-containing protein n=1 Tax=Tistlia consotensis USBA 355 TaxID=560819 RepID=A0A1Y6CKJ5_9PROT|nr:hypothetical protein SAMN05428998_12244 [Tistlia consotensis USBA 355]SNR63663.1 hypothetical protein SAMN06265365_10993 [Tistlia consotensis]
MDCVIKVDADQWIIVEISKRRDLDKVRTDVNRLVLVRRHLYDHKNIMSKCYFVCLYEPTDAMKDAGKPHNIEVLSRESYESKFFDYGLYVSARSKLQFGSSVHPITGKPDTTAYVPVQYTFKEPNKEEDIDGLSEIIRTSRKCVITGEYGSGKSRCVKEVFLKLSRESSEAYYFAIDLKTTWGLQSGQEIIRRHFDQLGLSDESDFAIRALNAGHVGLLLDGFDEVGSQSWSDDPQTLQRIRFDSLRGVRDLIQASDKGALITGREHYFNSTGEMMKCLGLEKESTLEGRCKDEFSDEELERFLNLISDSVLIVPEWLPRRPLMCQAIASLDEEELAIILEDDNGDISFWNTFLTVMCRREERIREILDADSIKSILVRLARMTRAKDEDVGPISYSEIQDAFESVLGTHPVQEASVLLQRLPGLGRTSLDNDDRRFIDTYILDGLRAIDLVKSIESFDLALPRESWQNPLSELGQRVLAKELSNEKRLSSALSYVHKINGGENKIAGCDIACSLLRTNASALDFKNMTLVEGTVLSLDFSHVLAKNLEFKYCIIYKMTLPDHPIDGVKITSCVIQKALGVSGPRGLPIWVQESEISEFEPVSTVSAIKNVNLTHQHKILVTILKKTFFQPGSGRQEAALLRGLGQVDRHGYTEKILGVLISEGILRKVRGDHGNLFVPDRKFSARVGKMLSELNLS